MSAWMVYALGITPIETIRDKGPFVGMTDLQMQQAKVQHGFIPAAMERWIQKVLSKLRILHQNCVSIDGGVP